MADPQVKQPVVLIILDGFGYREAPQDNAIYHANTPNWDALWKNQPHTLISGSGLDVGLPDGQMGNSEVGHMSLGAGRIIYQNITRIDKEIADGSFFDNDVYKEYRYLCESKTMPPPTNLFVTCCLPRRTCPVHGVAISNVERIVLVGLGRFLHAVFFIWCDVLEGGGISRGVVDAGGWGWDPFIP